MSEAKLCSGVPLPWRSSVFFLVKCAFRVSLEEFLPLNVCFGDHTL